MKLSLKDTVKTALPLFLICVIIAGALGMTNELTKEPIAAMEAAAEQAARQEVLPGAVAFEAIQVSGAEFAPDAAYDSSKNLIGYIVVTTGTGYGGTLKVMTGFNLEGEISGVSVISQNETVGLGTKCEKEEFRDQFKQEVPKDGFVVYKSGAAPDNGIEAITSATRTSNAVVSAVNTAIELYQTVSKGVK